MLESFKKYHLCKIVPKERKYYFHFDEDDLLYLGYRSNFNDCSPYLLERYQIEQIKDDVVRELEKNLPDYQCFIVGYETKGSFEGGNIKIKYGFFVHRHDRKRYYCINVLTCCLPEIVPPEDVLETKLELMSA